MAIDLAQLGDLGSLFGSLFASASQGSNPDNSTNNNPDAIGRAPGANINSLIQKQLNANAIQEAYKRAAIDPNSAYAQNLSTMLKSAMQEDIAKSVMADIVGQQRMKARGYNLANTARQDEARSSAISEGYAKAGLTSRLTAAQMLQAIAGMPATNYMQTANSVLGMNQQEQNWHQGQQMLQMGMIPINGANAAAANQNRNNLYSGLPQIFSGVAGLASQSGLGDWISNQMFGPSEDVFSGWDMGGASDYGIDLSGMGSDFGSGWF